jgi:transaldolase
MTAAVTLSSPLQQMTSMTCTEFWNDSCSIEELTYAIEHGAVGATSNPTIVLTVLKKAMPLWSERIHQIIAQNPAWAEVDITWKVIEEVALAGARLLQPIYEREQGKTGRLSIQTNPANYRTAEALIEQALHFSKLAPNLQVKIPASAAGLKAIEEVTAQGVNINATVSFSVAQAAAVAEAVERGLDRRRTNGGSTSEMTPVCTIMVGRVDDWMQAVTSRANLAPHPAHLPWAGVAVMKKAYTLYQERGYRTRLLVAAYRHHLHRTEFIGGNVILTIPYEWQKRFNASNIAVTDRMGVPVDQAIIDGLYSRIPEFRKVYDVDGLTVNEFDRFGATVRTLRGFIASYHELAALIRERFMLPNPDIVSLGG